MKMKYLLLVLIGIFTSNILAQDNSTMDFKTETKLLEEKKAKLLNEKKSLRNELDEMAAKIQELDAEYKAAWPKFLVKKYGKKDGNNLALGRIWKGMTQDMMLDIWGEPDKKHTDKFSYGVYTQFYYGKITYFFKDRKLIDWEEVE